MQLQLSIQLALRHLIQRRLMQLTVHAFDFARSHKTAVATMGQVQRT